MKTKIVKIFILCILLNCATLVNAEIKCDNGKPGDTINCAVTNNGYSGTLKKLKESIANTAITFESCDVCSDNEFTIQANVTANFKFKIDPSINESKTLNISFAGETASIKVNVETETEEESPNETTYTVTLIPGNANANITKSCTVNSLNTTCNVTLDDLDEENFTGWDEKKDCTEGSKGTIKVNKDVTYYACFKKKEESENSSLLLKSLVVKNGDEEIDLGFSIRIKEYTITVPTNVESLDVTAVAQDEEADVLISGQDDLKEDSIIRIVLTKGGSSNEYIINVKKSDKTEAPLLSNLIVGGYNLNFDPKTFSYNLTIDKGIKELNIEATPENDTYEIEITGNKDLKNESKINIVVTEPETKASSTYVINIEQEVSNIIIYIAIGAVLLIILIILLIIVVKKGKKSNKNQQVKEIPTNAKPINNKANIPEIKSPIPQSNRQNNKSEEIETLDL